MGTRLAVSDLPNAPVTHDFFAPAQMCHLAESSIKKALDQNDNAAYLLSLHRPTPQEEQDFHELGATRFIRIK